MLGANPPTSRPAVNNRRPAANGAAVPRAAALPSGDDAEQAAEEEPAEHPAVEPEPTQVVGDDGHHRRDGQRLEGDERDGEDEPEGEPPTLGIPDAGLDGPGVPCVGHPPMVARSRSVSGRAGRREARSRLRLARFALITPR